MLNVMPKSPTISRHITIPKNIIENDYSDLGAGGAGAGGAAGTEAVELLTESVL